MRKIKYIKDIVDWGLCVGCGACYYFCNEDSIELINIENIGIRPYINDTKCLYCTERKGCLKICPGYQIEARQVNIVESPYGKENIIIGQTLQVWEGYARDKKIRFKASSGGVITALALYCLEKKKMNFVLHVGMNPKKPWENITVVDKNKKQLLMNCGSRYQTSSVCDSLELIQKSSKPCIFIGRPCDVAAISMLRKVEPDLDRNLGLVLSFFCAGTPSTKGTKELLNKMKVDIGNVKSVRYRGNGWPGNFTVVMNNGDCKQLSYIESWGFLTDYRPFRCQICPDGFGELSDISCGDAWHKYNKSKEDKGRSFILAHTMKGKMIIKEAMKAGYLDLVKSTLTDVINAQELVKRRKEIFGRQFAMNLLMIPTTNFKGFYLFRNWLSISVKLKIISILGTLRRLLIRGLWHRNPINWVDIKNLKAEIRINE